MNWLLTLSACEAVARLPTLKWEENFGHLIRLLRENETALQKQR